ncbi:MAG TPA: hypothetical protein VHB27_17415, partial [Rhodopila sp.]|uniref:hypothetical protein n=1 Tax=Rhodopila sp. TaxID=2480087 RepID=UPI002C2033E5
MGVENAAQHGLGGLAVSGQTEKGGEVGACGDIARVGPQRGAHGVLRRFDLAGAVSGDAQVHPGIGEIRGEARGGLEALGGTDEEIAAEIGKAEC